VRNVWAIDGISATSIQTNRSKSSQYIQECSIWIEQIQECSRYEAERKTGAKCRPKHDRGPRDVMVGCVGSWTETSRCYRNVEERNCGETAHVLQDFGSGWFPIGWGRMTQASDGLVFLGAPGSNFTTGFIKFEHFANRIKRRRTHSGIK
jgi:hypothetical protein